MKSIILSVTLATSLLAAACAVPNGESFDSFEEPIAEATAAAVSTATIDLKTAAWTDGPDFRAKVYCDEAAGFTNPGDGTCQCDGLTNGGVIGTNENGDPNKCTLCKWTDGWPCELTPEDPQALLTVSFATGPGRPLYMVLDGNTPIDVASVSVGCSSPLGDSAEFALVGKARYGAADHIAAKDGFELSAVCD